MNFDRLEKILINTQSNLDKNNIIDKIKGELKKQNKIIHKKWRKNDFNINYLFNVTLTTQDGQVDKEVTLLHVAVYINQLEVVKSLADKGADFNIRNNYGGTPLHYAAKDGQLEIVKYFVDELRGEKKADVNAKNKEGNTTLDVATENGYSDIVEYFNEKKVAADAKNNSGNVPSYVTTKEIKPNTVQSAQKGKNIVQCQKVAEINGSAAISVGLSMLDINNASSSIASIVKGITGGAILKPSSKLNESNVSKVTITDNILTVNNFVE